MTASENFQSVQKGGRQSGKIKAESLHKTITTPGGHNQRLVPDMRVPGIVGSLFSRLLEGLRKAPDRSFVGEHLKPLNMLLACGQIVEQSAEIVTIPIKPALGFQS